MKTQDRCARCDRLGAPYRVTERFGLPPRDVKISYQACAECAHVIANEARK